MSSKYKKSTKTDFSIRIFETKLSGFHLILSHLLFYFNDLRYFSFSALKEKETFAQNGLRTNAQWKYNLIWMYVHMTSTWHHLNIFSCMHYVLSRKADFSSFLREINFFQHFIQHLKEYFFSAIWCFPVRPKDQCCCNSS